MSDTPADRGHIPHPKSKHVTYGRKYGSGMPPFKMKPIQGVGRNAGRGYCKQCGHTKARCICKPS